MKKQNFIIILFLSLISFSCSSDSDNLPKSLSSIKKEFYVNGNLQSYSVSNFENNKLISRQYSRGLYDEIIYNGNLVSKILEFDSDNSLKWTESYQYDNSGRMLLKKRDPNPSYFDVNHKHEIVYDDNENSILFNIYWSDGGASNRKIFLDNNNRIKGEVRDNLNDAVYTYSDNNLMQVIEKRDNNIVSELKFNYLSKEVSEFYNYEKYLFGTEWKNNLALDAQFGYALDPNAHKFSNNYVSNYQLIIHGTSVQFTFTGSFEYEFDSDGDIIKQVENSNNNKHITTYTYN